MENKILELQQNQNNLRELEQFYNNGIVDNLLENIEKEKEKVVNEMINFAEERRTACKWNKDGDELAFEVQTNPIVINQTFFKPILKINSQEPQYNAEKLAMVYDYYTYLVAEVNDKICNYPSSLKSFCRFAGITTTTLRNYKNCDDLNMRIIAEKIYDQVEDDNITMGQLGIAKEKTTIFKLKTQNEVIEREQPKISINITEKPDTDRIAERLEKYKVFAEKR